jgi:hypothetical protein
MDNEKLESLNELEYAQLPESQERRLRELEKQFNNEFGKDYYFMIMKRKS